ncbi:MAG: adenine phosphoribosyltransferase [bacterium]
MQTINFDYGFGEGRIIDRHTEHYLKSQIQTLENYPASGVSFKDITSLLSVPGALSIAVARLSTPLRDVHVDAVAAVESRGFIIGAPLAADLGTGLILVRKPGKLPGEIDSFQYSCEYCSGTLEVKGASIRSGGEYVICDDVLATGGTARATADYIARKGGVVKAYSFLIELSQLRGRNLLNGAPIYSLLHF